MTGNWLTILTLKKKNHDLEEEEKNPSTLNLSSNQQIGYLKKFEDKELFI